MHARTSILALLLVTLAPALTACEKHTAAPEPAVDPIDALTDDLLIALRQGARDDLLALANPALADDLDERDVAVIARTFAWLGQLTGRSVLSEQPLSGGVERRYSVTFERSEVELSVSVVNGKLEGFAFDEAVWASVVERAAEAAAGTLRVATFQFVDRKGKPLTQPSDPAAIDYDLALEGLDAQLREHHVTIAKRVFDAEGHQVYRQPDDDEIRFSQAEAGSTGGKLSGNVKVPGPGSYVLELEIHDQIGTTTLVHRVEFVIAQ